MGCCCSISGRGRNDSTETYRDSHQGERDKSEEEGGLRRCEQSRKTMGCCCSIRGRGRNDSTETYRESHQGERDKSEEEGGLRRCEQRLVEGTSTNLARLLLRSPPQPETSPSSFSSSARNFSFHWYRSRLSKRCSRLSRLVEGTSTNLARLLLRSPPQPETSPSSTINTLRSKWLSGNVLASKSDVLVFFFVLHLSQKLLLPRRS
ncbi:hypothetical protein J6590_086694 [Homalodisca vitripennis]|nr:hypothetical protein J6590_086694 [Homalodisca vitripennis]